MRLRIFIAVGHELTEVDLSVVTEPHVGIWWQGDGGVVAYAQSLASVEAPMPLLDSDLAHNDMWPHAQVALGCGRASEYFDTPRGRVLWDGTTGSGIIYHGNATGRVQLSQVAAMFGLPQWRARLDDHYLVGESLEEFYGAE